jgi:hypothetical protein
MRIVVGKSITNGRLYFESWVYDNWRAGSLTDPLLLRLLESCYHFYDFYTKHVLWTKPVRVFK